MVGRDGAGGRGPCWGLWSAGGYSPTAREAAPVAADTYVHARDLGVLLSVRGRLECGLLGRRKIRPSLVGGRIFRLTAILRGLRSLRGPRLETLVWIMALVLGTLLVGI